MQLYFAVFTDEELDELLDRSAETPENKGSHFQVVNSTTGNNTGSSSSNNSIPSTSNDTIVDKWK